MKNTSVRGLLYLGLVVLYLLHNDLWYWHDTSLVLGIPVGLFYHIAFCLTASGLLYLLVTYAWPRHLEVETEEEPRP
jgi:hypothetical protein